MNPRKTEIRFGHLCLDEDSGLYNSGHFQAVLGQELARLDRWERPLSLVLAESPHLAAESWPGFGRLLRLSLRPFDLAARLGPRRAAVILPDADPGRARRWLNFFRAQLDRDDFWAGRDFRFGRATARPWEGRQAPELLALAEARLLGREPDGEPEADEAADTFGTAIAADERSLLFAGFQALTGRLEH